MPDTQPVAKSGSATMAQKIDDISISPVMTFRKYLLLVYKHWRIVNSKKMLTSVMVLLPCLFVVLSTQLLSEPKGLNASSWTYSEIPLFFGFLLLVVNIPREINEEKEQRMKEAMRMMGVSRLLQWISWWTKYTVIMVFISIFITLLCKLPVTLTQISVAANTDAIVIFLVFLLWGLANISFGCFISTLCNTATGATGAAVVLYGITWVPFLFLAYMEPSSGRIAVKMLCLLPNTALPTALLSISYSESYGVEDQDGRGAKWYGVFNYSLGGKIVQNISVGEIYLLLVAHILLLVILTWYTEAVFPGKYGVAEKSLFFLSKSYWFGASNQAYDEKAMDKSYKAKYLSNPFNEKDPSHITTGIYISGLAKQFGPTLAVNGLHLKIFKDQITSFLGHNGAGKTTTMSMLSGLISPTSGTAIVNGHDIRKDLNAVRASLGFCPQHDILFKNLTIEEHLYLFGTLKGCPSSVIGSEIDYYVNALDLGEKRHELAKTLSGGQKRKLSVCIALIARSKVVILDEPTSGMDPTVRRQVWDLLQSQRTGRTILLSTHYMDEADHLGDRIAIVAEGELQCCGSSLFLKKYFGQGYSLIMNTDPKNVNLPEIDKLIKSHVKNALSRGQNGAEVSYVLPAASVSAFPALFNKLESKQAKLGVFGFGASVATMEDVFRRVGEAKLIKDEVIERPSKCMLVSRQPPAKNAGFSLFAQQLRGFITKRMLYTIRSKGLTFFQLAMPLAFTILACLVTDIKIIRQDPQNFTIADLASTLPGSVFPVFICPGYIFFLTTFILYVISERVCKSKHSQATSGARWYMFWLGNLIWDYLIIYTVVSVVMVIVIVSFSSPWISKGSAPAMFLLILMMYGFSSISLTYLLHFLFESQSLAYILLWLYNISTSSILVNVITNAVAPEDQGPYQTWFPLLFPNYAFALALPVVFTRSRLERLCQIDLPHWEEHTLSTICSSVTSEDGVAARYCCDLKDDDLTDLRLSYLSTDTDGPTIGWYLLSFLLQSVVCWILIILIESDIIIRLCYKFRPKKHVKSNRNKVELGQEDSDVAAERRKVMQKVNINDVTAPVVISGLSRYFGSFAAVDQLYLEIGASECFGLLGVNGAGKTTTFRMLTGDEITSGGTAYMAGSDIRYDINGVLKKIGYCPQFDALLDHMTGEEMLYMYARIRGIKQAIIPRAVNYLIKALDLTAHRHKLTCNYSGGNKRKLAVAISLTGDPPIVFLDEPTTGMDPVARRRVWDVLATYRKLGNTIVLTTHSMEEGEALCTRMAIMVNGKFRCLGGVQHLKNKFNAGYTIIVRIADSQTSNTPREEDTEDKQEQRMVNMAPQDVNNGTLDGLKKFIPTHFKGCRIVDEHLNVIQYHIPKGKHGCGSIFKIMEAAKKKYNIEDYTVSQTTIEQVFLNLAREQRTGDRKDTLGSRCTNLFRRVCSICMCCVPEYVEIEEYQ